MGDGSDDTPYGKFAMSLFKILDGPVTFVKEKVVDPLQSKNDNKYYHRRYPRVTTIDQCEVEDPVCVYEAQEQFRRDKLEVEKYSVSTFIALLKESVIEIAFRLLKVDSNIVKILRQRKLECYQWEGPDAKFKCQKVSDDYEQAATNWFIKYGDIGANGNVIDAYMKQKHRLIWHRRHPDMPLM